MKRKKPSKPAREPHYSGDIELRLPVELLKSMTEIAIEAECSVQTVIRVLLSVHMRQERASQGKETSR